MGYPYKYQEHRFTVQGQCLGHSHSHWLWEVSLTCAYLMVGTRPSAHAHFVTNCSRTASCSHLHWSLHENMNAVASYHWTIHFPSSPLLLNFLTTCLNLKYAVTISQCWIPWGTLCPLPVLMVCARSTFPFFSSVARQNLGSEAYEVKPVCEGYTENEAIITVH